jgi:hypothetical protein
MTDTPGTEPDVEHITAALDRHHVGYLLVGGVNARLQGAQRPTLDLDCLPLRHRDNLARLAAAMTDLNARIRVEGLTDDQARALPVRLDAATLYRIPPAPDTGVEL